MNLVTRICIRNALVSLLAQAQQWFKDKVWHLEWKLTQFKARQAAAKAARAKGFHLPVVRHDSPVPSESNPFHHDMSNMGTTLVRGWVAMHQGFDSPERPFDLTFLVLVNTRTGQRIHINLQNCYPGK